MRSQSHQVFTFAFYYNRLSFGDVIRNDVRVLSRDIVKIRRERGHEISLCPRDKRKQVFIVDIIPLWVSFFYVHQALVRSLIKKESHRQHICCICHQCKTFLRGRHQATKPWRRVFIILQQWLERKWRVLRRAVKVLSRRDFLVQIYEPVFAGLSYIYTAHLF